MKLNIFFQKFWNESHKFVSFEVEKFQAQKTDANISAVYALFQIHFSEISTHLNKNMANFKEIR